MFLAHKNDLALGYSKPLAQYEKKKTLVNSDGELSLLSNVCPHQLSLLSIKEKTGNLVCPYHNWSFDLTGAPLTSGRTGHYCKNIDSLKSFDIFTMNSLIFDIDIKCEELSWLDLSKMQLKEYRTDTVYSNSKIIMDVFLDVDHIQSVHAGVYDRIGLPKIDQVQWHYYSWGSLQLVSNGNEYGAAWLAVYPGTMIEWQPGALFVTVAVPIDNNETMVHVFKYSDNEETWRLNDSVWELAWSQDQVQAELITGFTNNNLEESKKHFRQWLTK